MTDPNDPPVNSNDTAAPDNDTGPHRKIWNDPEKSLRDYELPNGIARGGMGIVDK